MDVGEASLGELVAAVRAEGRDLGREVDLDGAERLSGWESVVVSTADGWIYRFPRPHVEFERELAVLRALDGQAAGRNLPAPIPEPVWMGRSVPFMAYRRLDGVELDLGAYERATSLRRDQVADSLAGFLAAMHTALSPDDARNLGVPAPDAAADRDEVERLANALVELPALVRPQMRDVLDHAREYADGAAPARLLHDDFNLSNLVLTGPTGVLAGVWDFSCVRIGDPSLDLRYLVGDSVDLFDRVADRYAARTDVVPDRRRAVLAHRVETISDALELRQFGELEARAAHWRAADGDGSLADGS